MLGVFPCINDAFLYVVFSTDFPLLTCTKEKLLLSPLPVLFLVCKMKLPMRKQGFRLVSDCHGQMQEYMTSPCHPCSPSHYLLLLRNWPGSSSIVLCLLHAISHGSWQENWGVASENREKSKSYPHTCHALAGHHVRHNCA